MLAIEAAQQLLARNETVYPIALIHTATGSYPRYSPTATSLRRLIYRMQYRVALEWNNMIHKSAREKGRQLLTRGRRAASLVLAQTEALAEAMPVKWPGLHQHHSTTYDLEQLADAHDRVWRNYVPKPYAGAVTFITAEKQLKGIVPDPLLGWDGLLTGTVRHHALPCFRQTILDEPCVGLLANALTESMDREL